jgi:hypothetical protein
MPVPLPDLDHVRLTPPDAVEVQAIDCGVASAVSGSGGLTPLQQFLIEALFPAMTGHGVDLSLCSPMTAHEIAETLAARNLAFRTRGVQIMVLCALVLRPLPEQVVDQIARAAGELGVDEGVIEVFRGFAEGSFGLAAIDFERNGCTASWTDEDRAVLHSAGAWQSFWDASVPDGELSARWRSARGFGAGHAGSVSLGVVPGARIPVPRDARGASAPRAGTTGCTSWRTTGRPSRTKSRRSASSPRQRRHVSLLVPRDGHLPLRNRLPPLGGRPLRVRSRPSER